jgi:superfamily II DNA/RNA helicase
LLSLLPSSAPVQRAVHKLRDLGVNAYSLDLLVADKSRAHLLQGSSEASDDPIMLVSTTATTRRLDLPELTRVFMLGLPKDCRADTYLHIAGRVGRFGRPGKVITVVDKREEKRKKDRTLAWIIIIDGVIYLFV